MPPRAYAPTLIAHCAGRPSATQMAMIEQATELKLRLAVMDHAFIRTSRRSAHASRDYLAWSNSMVRLLRQLGLRGVSEALDGGALRSAQQAGSRAMTGVCYLTATHSRPNRHQRTETGGIPPFLRAEAPDRLSGVRLNWPAAAPYSALTRVPADLPGSAAPSSMLLASPMTR